MRISNPSSRHRRAVPATVVQRIGLAAIFGMALMGCGGGGGHDAVVDFNTIDSKVGTDAQQCTFTITVEVHDQSDKLLVHEPLGTASYAPPDPGYTDGRCRFHHKVHLPKADFYKVSYVGYSNLGVTTYSAKDLASTRWTISKRIPYGG